MRDALRVIARYCAGVAVSIPFFWGAEYVNGTEIHFWPIILIWTGAIVSGAVTREMR